MVGRGSVVALLSSPIVEGECKAADRVHGGFVDKRKVWLARPPKPCPNALTVDMP
jgi:hypothetical protein